MSQWVRYGKIYAGVMGTLGFCRGYDHLYESAGPKFNTREELVTENIKNGVVGALWQLNPGAQPVFLYYMSRRVEKRFRDMPLLPSDYED